MNCKLNQNESNEECGWFTFSTGIRKCELFRSCSVLDTKICSDCLSGQQYCRTPEQSCWVQGKCSGIANRTVTQPSIAECLKLCIKMRECHWLTYHQVSNHLSNVLTTL